MHPTPRRVLLGTAAAPLATPACYGPATSGDVTKAHLDGLPSIPARVAAA